MLSVFENENENHYIAGIQNSLKFVKIKIDGIQSTIQKFWYMSGIQTKKSHMKLYNDLFLLLCALISCC